MHTTPQQSLHWSLLLWSVHCTAQLGAADWLLLGTGLCLTLRSQVSPDCEADGGANCHTVTQIEPAWRHLLAR